MTLVYICVFFFMVAIVAGVFVMIAITSKEERDD